VISDTAEFETVPLRDLIQDTPGKHRRGETRSPIQRRTCGMYLTIVLAWVLLCTPMIWAFIPIAEAGFNRNIALGVALIVSELFIGYFWLNGIKDIIFPLIYRLTSWRDEVQPVRPRTSSPNVALVYVTCDDFSADSLLKCLNQDYDNFWTVILDDSTKQEYMDAVDAFGKTHGIPVLRRPNKPSGFKAGNLNYFLHSRFAERIDYFVIIDSDEILQAETYISRSLDYFDSPEVGIVQANHIATRNRTRFMKMFAPGVDSHWPVYQIVKQRAGFLSLLGHGAMVSMKAYRAAVAVNGTGFPEIVAEDIGLAIDMLQAGFRVKFAPDIICEEEFPIDYWAFKKRHKKWTEGNMEFIRTYNRKIFFDKAFRWYERLDIILFTYSLPLTGFFSAYIILNDIVFPEVHFRDRFPLWMLIPTVTFLLAPMLNDMLTFRRQPRKMLRYLIHSVGLFGSMYFVSLFASLKTTFGGSVFNVTPKLSGSVKLRDGIRYNTMLLVSSSVMMGSVVFATGSVFPVILIVLPALSSVYLSVMNRNDAYDETDNGDHFLVQNED